MGVRARTKKERQRTLVRMLQDNPLYTDEELAGLLGVSVPTIRLDRMELGLPEMRERARQLAESAQQNLKTLLGSEVAGDLLDLTLGESGISMLEITEEMCFSRTRIVRGHHIFAQANSLAVAIIDADVALTGTARLHFLRPVRAGERVIAKAQVVSSRKNKFMVEVNSNVEGHLVFSGEFLIAAIEDDGQPGRGEDSARTELR